MKGEKKIQLVLHRVALQHALIAALCALPPALPLSVLVPPGHALLASRCNLSGLANFLGLTLGLPGLAVEAFVVVHVCSLSCWLDLAEGALCAETQQCC